MTDPIALTPVGQMTPQDMTAGSAGDSPRIADYAIIGDGHSCALVSRAGSVDFLCWPRFDSDACFAALLGDARHGSWKLAPRTHSAAPRRCYREDTAILDTVHETASGRVRVIDFMAWASGPAALVRIVEGIDGTVPMDMRLRLRFQYGQIEPWTHQAARGLCAEIGPDRVLLTSDVEITRDGADGVACFSVAPGQRIAFVLTHSDSAGDMPQPPDPELLRTTERDWKAWIGRFDKPCRWPGPVKRSLMTLRLLSDRHTGGIIAAATTSLPEMPGGDMNWDYRYCWLRDSTFTLTALLNAGLHTEARRWRDWILRAVAGEPKAMQIAYRIDGGRRLPEYVADWLPGWQGARPVRIGNAAASQTQIDVYGELLDCFDVAARAGIERSERVAAVERAIVDHLESAWDRPGAGIWEGRGEPRRHTYSQAMAWVAVNRYLRAHGGDDDATLRLRRLEATIHATVCAHGFSAERGHFTDTYNGEALDGSLLLLPIVGFIPATDPRMEGTIAAIERGLMEGGLVRRKPAGNSGKEEGAFIACSCWLADCFVLQGRTEAACRLLERVIALANDVGLLSEEYHVPTNQLVGNMPQALSHVGVVNTALSLSGPVIRRGGA